MTIMTLPVRRAVPQDRSAILDLCKLNWAENGQFSLSVPKVEAMVDRGFTGQGGVIGVVGEPNAIEGLIIMTIGQFWYTDDWCLEEILNFVHPEHRKSTHAKDMIAFGKRASDELGIPLVIGVVSNERTRAKIELYRRQLGEMRGGYFIHVPAGTKDPLGVTA